MTYAKWRNWAYVLLWIHIVALLANGLTYGLITFSMDVPFLTIYQYPETAPYYLATYAFILIFTFTLCSLGLIFGDLFGQGDLRAQLVSRGLLIIGVLGSLLPITLITMWDLALKQPIQSWSNVVLAVQYFGIWLTMSMTAVFACIMILIFFLAKERASIPNGWKILCVVLASLSVMMSVCCFWITEFVILYRVVYLAGAICYLIWAFWLALFIKKAR